MTIPGYQKYPVNEPKPTPAPVTAQPAPAEPTAYEKKYFLTVTDWSQELRLIQLQVTECSRSAASVDLKHQQLTQKRDYAVALKGLDGATGAACDRIIGQVEADLQNVEAQLAGCKRRLDPWRQRAEDFEKLGGREALHREIKIAKLRGELGTEALREPSKSMLPGSQFYGG